MRIIDRFSSEHGGFIERLDRLEGLVEEHAASERVLAAVRELAAPLFAHAENEEHALFRDLEPLLGGTGGPLAILTEEHAAIHGQVDELTAAPTRERLELVLRELQVILRGHIEKEEDILFPAAAQLLGDDRLARLDDELVARAGIA